MKKILTATLVLVACDATEPKPDPPLEGSWAGRSVVVSEIDGDTLTDAWEVNVVEHDGVLVGDGEVDSLDDPDLPSFRLEVAARDLYPRAELDASLLGPDGELLGLSCNMRLTFDTSDKLRGDIRCHVQDYLASQGTVTLDRSG